MSADSPATIPSLTYARFEAIAPDGLGALLAMGKAVDAAGLEKTLTELVKLRVSQINGCAFCIALHLKVARRAGVENVRLDMLTAWRDTDLYTARERAALQWAEHVTRFPTAPVAAAAQAEIAANFTEQEITHLTVAIANINAWNRIAGALHFPPMPEG
ncbi:putative peroxidase-related enzyme [Martelella mangrovi]|uniref:Peroxidase-related enzyme n=1 Tax=Martelella mangrovi TaxID=1397477 RepID=A0ABV2IEV3_9HYPH